MSTLYCTRHGFDDQVCFSAEHDQRWSDLRKIKMSPPEAEFMHLKNGHGHLPNNCCDPLPSGKRRPASARGV
jgi:hypothetical protein